MRGLKATSALLTTVDHQVTYSRLLWIKCKIVLHYPIVTITICNAWRGNFSFVAIKTKHKITRLVNNVLKKSKSNI
jgi:hypothetical protein